MCPRGRNSLQKNHLLIPVRWSHVQNALLSVRCHSLRMCVSLQSLFELRPHPRCLLHSSCIPWEVTDSRCESTGPCSQSPVSNRQLQSHFFFAHLPPLRLVGPTLHKDDSQKAVGRTCRNRPPRDVLLAVQVGYGRSVYTREMGRGYHPGAFPLHTVSH